MSELLSDDARLAADIDRLKVEFPKTRDLYREVCALLFFRFGIPPTANRLYSLVRRGTMSTPASVLSEFWAELREKSRVRIEHPDLPPDLRDAAGELIGTLWTRATASAHAELLALREEADARSAEAEQKVAAARDELGRMETALNQHAASSATAQTLIREMERQQAEDAAMRKAIEGEVRRLSEEAVARERDLGQVRESFSRDLEKLRETANRAEERLRATEKRALLEIDRERSAAAKLQKELAEAGKRAEKRDAEHRRTAESLQAQLGDGRHHSGMLQGKLAALETAHASLKDELKALRDADRAAARRPTTLKQSAVKRAASKSPAIKPVRARKPV